MTAEKRRGKILQLIRNNPLITNASISESLSIPTETVRSDLISLEHDGVLKRLHGRSEILRPQAVTERLIRSGALTREERREEMLKYIAEKGEVRVTTLVQVFGVSDATVRSDLAALDAKGSIRRDHGRAEFLCDQQRSVLLSALAEDSTRREIVHMGKRIIGNIEEGDVAYLDGSDYNVYVAMHIGTTVGAIILTNSLRVAMILRQRGYESDVYLLPGNVTGGSFATDLRFFEPVIRHFLVSKAFVVASGFDRRQGLLFEDRAAFEQFSEIAGHAKRLFVLIGSRAMRGRAAFTLPLSAVDSALQEIIVDDALTVEEAERVFPEHAPVVLCGDNYALTSPFSKQYVIGFSSLYGSYEFSQTVRQGIENAARKYHDVELLLTDNRMDPEVTMANIEMFIQRGVDLVIEYQHEYSLGPLIVEKLSAAEIPIIAIDIPIPGAVYFGVNNYRAGLVAGEKAVGEIDRRWGGAVDRIVTLTDSATGPISENRIAGMLERILPATGYPSADVVNVETTNDTARAEIDTEAALRGFRQEDRLLFLAFNDVVCLGALSAIRKLKREQYSIVVSHSHIRSISKELRRKESPLIGSVAFFPERYGERVIDLAMRILKKEPVSPNNYTEHQWITT